MKSSKAAVEQLIVFEKSLSKTEWEDYKTEILITQLKCLSGLNKYEEVKNRIDEHLDKYDLTTEHLAELLAMKFFAFFYLFEFTELKIALNKHKEFFETLEISRVYLKYKCSCLFVLINEKKRTEAIDLVDWIINKCLEIGDEHLAMRMKANKGALYLDQNDYENGVKVFEDLLPELEKKSQFHSIIVNRLNAGVCYFKLKNYEKAQACYDYSILLAKTHGYQNFQHLTNLKKAFIHLDLGNYNEAYGLSYRVYHHYKQKGSKNTYLAESIVIFLESSLNLNLRQEYDSIIQFADVWIENALAEDLKNRYRKVKSKIKERF